MELNKQNVVSFLSDLQRELVEQENIGIDCQASPRYWMVGDYRWVSTHQDAERYEIYLPSAGESFEINEHLKDIQEDDPDLSQEAKDAIKDIQDEDDAYEWFKEYVDEDANLIPLVEEHFLRQDTMFLTKREAQEHIKRNHYHYTARAHTYAMTAWRSPQVEKLMTILEKFDWGVLND